MTVIFALGTLGLLLGILMVVLKIYQDQEWLKAVIVPWMSALARAVNPDKK